MAADSARPPNPLVLSFVTNTDSADGFIGSLCDKKKAGARRVSGYRFAAYHKRNYPDTVSGFLLHLLKNRLLLAMFAPIHEWG